MLILKMNIIILNGIMIMSFIKRKDLYAVLRAVEDYCWVQRLVEWDPRVCGAKVGGAAGKRESPVCGVHDDVEEGADAEVFCGVFSVFLAVVFMRWP